VLDDFECGSATDNGMAAIAADDEIGTDVDLLTVVWSVAGGVVASHDAHDALLVSYEVYGFVPHEELK
jgi:hypothetical protein